MLAVVLAVVLAALWVASMAVLLVVHSVATKVY